MKFRSYRKLINFLKKKCPPAYPISVRRVKLSNLDGDCYKYKGRFYIRIARDLSENVAIETLLHEWAHARAWNHLHDQVEQDEFDQIAHDASWGVAYSEVYQLYEKAFLCETGENHKICQKFRPK